MYQNWVQIQFYVLTLTTRTYFRISHGDQKFFFQFEFIIYVLVSYFRFIWIPMSMIYGHDKSKVGPRTERVNIIVVTDAQRAFVNLREKLWEQ